MRSDGVDSNAVDSIGCLVAESAEEGLNSGRVSDSGEVGSIDGDESENIVEKHVMENLLWLDCLMVLVCSCKWAQSRPVSIPGTCLAHGPPRSFEQTI